MAYDFRASQVRTNKLITSGSTGTPASLLIYDISADGSPANQGNVDNGAFATSSIGADAFIYVSGSRSALSQSSGGVVIFGGDVHTSGTFQAITETSDDSFYQPPHVLVNSNTGGGGSIGDGGLFFSSVGMLGISGGTQYAGGIELSIRNSQTLTDGYFPSQSQIVIRNQSAGGIFLNSSGQWGGGGISIGAGAGPDTYNLANGEVFIFSNNSYMSMSAGGDLHIQAGTDESSTVKFYTFAVGPAIELTDVNNTAITASLANTTIIGAINELKVSASLGGGGGGSSVWTDAGTYIYNTASMIGASNQGNSTIVAGTGYGSIISSNNSQLRSGTGANSPTSSFILGSSASFISGSENSGIVSSRQAQITLNAEGLGVYNSYDAYIADPGGWGTFRSAIFCSETAKILGGFDSAIIATYDTTISQSDYSSIISSLSSHIDLQNGGTACTIIGGFLSDIRTTGAGYSTIIGPGIRNYNDYQMHIGYGGFATYGGQSPLVVISGSTHFSSGSGATFFNGLSGSLTRLSDGSSYLVAGTGVTITSASNGAVTISATGGGGGSSFPSRAQVGNYAVVTQSNSQTVGGNYIVASEHQSSSIELRTILSTTNSGNRAHLRLFSITDGYYLPIGGAGIFELSTTSTTPTVLTSSNLNAIVTSSILLEVQVSGTLTAGSLVITHHNSDLIFTD